MPRMPRRLEKSDGTRLGAGEDSVRVGVRTGVRLCYRARLGLG